MNQFLFFLGRTPQLSILELENFFLCKVPTLYPDIAIIQTNKEVEECQKALGGTIKIAAHIKEMQEEDIESYIFSEIEKQERTKKIFALNVFGIKNERKFIQKHLLNMKSEKRFSMRFVNKNFKNVNSVVTLKEIIRKKGNEFNIIRIKNSDKFLVSQTITCQNIDSYTVRDFKKPYRDIKVGMLPPKLAQILINIAGETKKIWDPFCGTGTVPMEAMLMGKSAIFSDNSEKMITDSEKNVEWLKKFFPINAGVFTESFLHDATKPINVEVDAVITEGYLGELKKKLITENERVITDDLLSEIYKHFFDNCCQNAIQTIVICLPVYKMKNGLGYMQKTLSAIYQSNYDVVPMSHSQRGSFVYSRDDQLVLREIIKFNLVVTNK